MAHVFPLSEGSFTVAADKVFKPFDPENDRLEDRVRGSLLVEIQPFLIQTKTDLLLLDAGLGFSLPNGKLQIHQCIEDQGFRPEEVTRVLVSHLHKDHAGGLVFRDASGQLQPSFPRAQYCIYGPELEQALLDKGESYVSHPWEDFIPPAQLQRLEGSSGWAGPGIQFFHSGAHSPQHIVFLIEVDGQLYFFGGDEAPQHKQMLVKYVAKYDFDGKKAQMLREQYKEQGKREGWTFLYYHDIGRPTARFQ